MVDRWLVDLMIPPVKSTVLAVTVVTALLSLPAACGGGSTPRPESAASPAQIAQPSATPTPPSIGAATPAPWPSTASHGPCNPQDQDGKSPAPLGRNLASAAFDPQAGLLFMTGGVMTQYACVEPKILWLWNRTSWRQAPGPPQGQLVYDSARHEMLALGAQTYRWTGDGWSATAGPAPMGIAAFDARRSEVLVYSSSASGSQTWLYDGKAWALANPAHQPPPRSYSVIAWDAIDGQVVLWGGSLAGQPSQNRIQETWTWDGSDWTMQATSAAPPSSELQGMTTGPAGALLYTVNQAGSAEAWAYSGSAWTKQTGTPPPSRDGPALAYDSINRMVYLFGGDRGGCCGGKTNELWSYDGTSWHGPS